MQINGFKFDVNINGFKFDANKWFQMNFNWRKTLVNLEGILCASKGFCTNLIHLFPTVKDI